jgi:hypothetical protein
MATKYSAQYQDAFVDVPMDKVHGRDWGGKTEKIYFSYALPSAVLALNDIVKLAKIPKGCRVLDAVLQFPDLGTGGTAELGFAADAAAVETADADAFLTTVDMKTAADCVSMQQQMEAGGSNAGFCKTFAAECDLQLNVSEATTATTGTIQGWIEIIKVG